MNEQIYFFAMLATAIIISRTPLRYPFLWMETFFHEFSHGLAAIVTFGWIHRIKLMFNGSGLCTTQGGLRIPILLAGYVGAVLWGAFIYLAGWVLNDSGDIAMLQFLMGILVICTILWVRNLVTLFIMIVMFLIFYLPTIRPDIAAPAYAIEFYGIYVLRSAITAPLDLIDGKHVGDGAALQDQTLIIPEGIWITIWFLFGVAVLFYLWQWTTATNLRIFDFLPLLPWLQ